MISSTRGFRRRVFRDRYKFLEWRVLRKVCKGTLPDGTECCWVMTLELDGYVRKRVVLSIGFLEGDTLGNPHCFLETCRECAIAVSHLETSETSHSAVRLRDTHARISSGYSGCPLVTKDHTSAAMALRVWWIRVIVCAFL